MSIEHLPVGKKTMEKILYHASMDGMMPDDYVQLVTDFYLDREERDIEQAQNIAKLRHTIEEYRDLLTKNKIKIPGSDW